MSMPVEGIQSMNVEDCTIDNIEIVPWRLQGTEIKHKIFLVSFSRNVALTSQEEAKNVLEKMRSLHGVGEEEYSVGRVKYIKGILPEDLSNFQEIPIFFVGPEENPVYAVPVDVYNSLFQFRV